MMTPPRWQCARPGRLDKGLRGILQKQSNIIANGLLIIYNGDHPLQVIVMQTMALYSCHILQELLVPWSSYSSQLAPTRSILSLDSPSVPTE